MEIEQTLEQYGLTEKESKIYLASLSLGTASIAQLSSKANLKRPTTYLIVEELFKKQLLISIPHGKKTYYKAEDPSELVGKFEQRKRQLENIIPQLQTLYSNSSTQPSVRFYEGKDQLYKIYEEIFKAKEIWALFSPQRFLEVFSQEDNEHFFRIAIRSGGMIHDLVEDSREARQLVDEKYHQGVSEVKYLPKDFTFSTDTIVYDDKVAIFSYPHVSVVILEDKEIAHSQRQMLKFIWSKV